VCFAGVWSPGQASPPQRDTSDTPKGEAAIGDSNQDHQPPVWIPASQQPSPRLERKEFRPVRLDTAALNKKQQVFKSSGFRGQKRKGYF